MGGNYDYEMPRILEALMDIRGIVKKSSEATDYTANKSQDIMQEMHNVENCIMLLLDEQRKQTELLRKIAEKVCNQSAAESENAEAFK